MDTQREAVGHAQGAVAAETSYGKKPDRVRSQFLDDKRERELRARKEIRKPTDVAVVFI